MVLILLAGTASSEEFYYNVSYEAGSMVSLWFGTGHGGDWTLDVTALNLGSDDYNDVGFVPLFFYHTDSNTPFTYDNSLHRWNLTNKWIQIYGYHGQDDLFSMARDVTNLPLTAEGGASLLETDQMPVFWLGDIPAGQQVQFTLYVQTSEPSFIFSDKPFFVSTTPPPIEASVQIKPETLNLQSKARWIDCHIWMPEDYNVADINSYSVTLEDEIQPEWIWLSEADQAVIAKFSFLAIQEILVGLQTPTEVELLVTGELNNGRRFQGTDVVRVVDKRRQKQQSLKYQGGR
jgi:hypothetical protein